MFFVFEQGPMAIKTAYQSFLSAIPLKATHPVHQHKLISVLDKFNVNNIEATDHLTTLLSQHAKSLLPSTSKLSFRHTTLVPSKLIASLNQIKHAYPPPLLTRFSTAFLPLLSDYLIHAMHSSLSHGHLDHFTGPNQYHNAHIMLFRDYFKTEYHIDGLQSPQLQVQAILDIIENKPSDQSPNPESALDQSTQQLLRQLVKSCLYLDA